MMVGAGAIFGELVAREFYDTLTMASLFIALSYLFGTACFSLVLLLVYRLEGRHLDKTMQSRLAKSLCVFIIAAFVIELARHLLNYFVSGNTAVEVFILRDAGSVTVIFWLGQLLVLLPVVLLCCFSVKKSRLGVASLLVTLGGLCQLYVIIIGGQLQPMSLFPNAILEINGSVLNSYSVSLPEIMLSIGGVAFILFIFTISAKVLCITPSEPR
jgi:molybdopterin-containing oxidoreductase family membrane subunit